MRAARKQDWQVHALCLMENHFHLVVETPKGNLVAAMKGFPGTMTLARIAQRLQMGAWTHVLSASTQNQPF